MQSMYAAHIICTQSSNTIHEYTLTDIKDTQSYTNI